MVKNVARPKKYAADFVRFGNSRHGLIQVSSTEARAAKLLV